jgi:hypothetical protein
VNRPDLGKFLERSSVLDLRANAGSFRFASDFNQSKANGFFLGVSYRRYEKFERKQKQWKELLHTQMQARS